MAEMKGSTSTATLLGDVVGSRAAPDRARLHAEVEAVLRRVNARLDPVVDLHVTTGDEVQGCFATVGHAAAAALLLRLDLLPASDLRCGLGWGPVTVLAEQPRVEDGPGWWSARAAIESVTADAARAAFRTTRTAYRRAEGLDAVDGPGEAAVNAALRLRDRAVGGLSGRSLTILRGLIEGQSQAELAESLGISASAVSQRVRADGLAMIVAAEQTLGDVR